jgi:purine-binding chemotaxis protein CheW
MSTFPGVAASAELDEAGTDEQQYLAFRLGDETFALSILAVKEILEYGGLTAVPMMPACVRGVINLRGRVVPVVDLAVRFGRPASIPGRRTCMVIVEVTSAGEAHDIGVIVDAVSQVIEIPPEAIEPAPAGGLTLRTEFLAGIGKMDGQFVLLLDGDRVLSVEEIAQLGQAEPLDGKTLALPPATGH